MFDSKHRANVAARGDGGQHTPWTAPLPSGSALRATSEMATRSRHLSADTTDEFSGWSVRSGQKAQLDGPLVPAQKLPAPGEGKQRRDSMFTSILEDKRSSLYTPQQLIGEAVPDNTLASSCAPLTQLLSHVEQCLSLPPSKATARQQQQETAQRRRRWADDLGEFFEHFGTRIELDPGDVLVSPEGIGSKRGLDCAYFVLQGVVVEESIEEGEEVYYPAGSLLNTDCFLQGAMPTAVLLAAELEPSRGDSFKVKRTTQKGSSPTGSPPQLATPGARDSARAADRSSWQTMSAGSSGSFHTGSFSKGRRGRDSHERPGGSPALGASGRPSQERPGSPGAAIDKCIVARLEFDKAIKLITEQPHISRRFFVALAAGLTELLQTRSTELRSAVRAVGSHGSHGALDGTAHETMMLTHHDRTAFELADAFRLPGSSADAGSGAGACAAADERMLLASCDCVVSIEEHSEFIWRSVRARFYLLGTHICIEHDHPLRMVDCLADRRAIALSDVLGLLDLREGKGEPSEADTADDAFQQRKGAKSATAMEMASLGSVVSISVRSGSVYIALPPKIFDDMVKEIELARLSATDTSNLSSEEKDEASMQTQSGWAVLRASLNLARGKRMALSDAARAAVAKSRRSFVSTGSGLTPRPSDIVQAVTATVPERESLKMASKRQVAGNALATDNDGFSFVRTSSEASGVAEVGPNMGGPPRAVAQVVPTASAPAPASAEPKLTLMGGDAREILKLSDWKRLLAGARYRKYRAGQKIIRSGNRIDGLIQVVNGNLRVELPQIDRPQALVVGRLVKGDILGEKTLLLGTPPSIEVVCESEFALVLRLPKDHLARTFIEHPDIAAKFFCLLAVRMASRLRKVNEQDLTEIENVISGDTHAPQTMNAISENPAFFLILHKFVLGSQRWGLVLGPTLHFIQESHLLFDEPDVDRLAQMVRALYEQHLTKSATKPLSCISDKMRAEVGMVVDNMLRGGGGADDPQAWRHVFDAAVKVGMKAIEDACFKQFLQSRHYQYVLTLKSKELIIPTNEHFRVAKLLGEGGFGQVVSVVKRDCGLTYAMKIQQKGALEEAFGDDWEGLALTERQLLSSLRHALLVNLAYAFQTIDQLVLVMDACPNGDLSRYGAPSEIYPDEPRHKLEKEQVRFIAMEVCCIVKYLHSRHVLYRDLKCENLLLDGLGHVRLIDFGVSKQGKGKGKRTTAKEQCGTKGYMAPEIHHVVETLEAYSYEADWFSYGVVVYELCEHAMPYGSDPLFVSLQDEFRNPLLLDEDGVEVPHLYDMLAALLDWDPQGRLADDNVCDHAYWGENTDWELADRGRLPSPMMPAIEAQRSSRSSSSEKSKGKRNSRNRVSVADAQSLVIAKSLATSQKKAQQAEEASFKVDADDVSNDLAREAIEMHVEGWDFVSEHALAREYVISAADVISIV